MTRFFVLISLVVVFLSVKAFDPSQEFEEIIELNAKNFNQTITNNPKNILVQFYAPVRKKKKKKNFS